MNKLVLDNIVFSLQNAGGISVLWQEILKKILNLGLSNYTCVEYPDALSNIFRNQIRISESNILRAKGPLSITRYFSPNIAIDDPVVFHSSYYRTISNKNVKNITTVHDFTYELLSNGFRQKIHSWQKNKSILKSDAVVCISQNTAKDLLRFCPHVNQSNIRIIYNGVSDDYYPLENSNDSLRDSILFIGMRSGYKNFKYTVDSISATKYKLMICGSPLNDEETSFLNSKLGKDKYSYLGRVSNHELNQLYNSIFCLAYPSSYEGFGIPVLEAQRAKCPVIAFNSSSIPEVIGDKSFLLDKLNTSEFRNRLKALENERIREEIIEKGFEHSLNFSWDKMSSEYLDLYEELSMA